MTTPAQISADSPKNGDGPAGRPERRIAINSGLLLLAYGFQAAVSLVILGVIARYLGQAGLGRYALVISFIELFIAFIDLGMNRILVREISKDLEHADRYTSVIWTMRLLLSAAMLVIVAIAASSTGDNQLWLAIMVYYIAQTLFLLGDVFNSVFHGFQRMEYQFWGVLLSQAALLVFTVAVVLLDLGLVALFGARLLANGLKLIIVWIISNRRFAQAHLLWGIIPGFWVTITNLPGTLRRWRLEGREEARAWLDSQGQALGQHWQDTTLAWRMLVESLPVGISLILRSYIWRGGIVLTVLWLGQQQGDLVNGLLYGPLRVVQQMRIIPAAFAAAMLPVFSNRAEGRMEEFDSAFAKSIKLFAAISLLIALAFTFLADPIVTFLLGSDIDLAGAAQVLAFLGWVVVLYFPSWLYGVALVALGRQHLETIGLALGLLVGFLIANWTIPAYGALGVSLSIIAAEAVLFAVGTAAMWQHFHWRELAPGLARIIAACVATGLVFALGDRFWQQQIAPALPLGDTLTALLELLLLGGLGLAVFVGGLWLLRAFDEDEQDAVRAMLRLPRGGS
ncbi:MAG: flippase [Chloroflexota bacterium]|nr:flippase [Chloroflexota bacterium]